MGRKRRVEVTPPVSRYEQVARRLRERVFSGEFPPGAKLPSGPELARDPSIGVSQHSVQRAFELLAREGIVRMTSGSGTEVLERSRWRVQAHTRLPPDEKIRASALTAVSAALRNAASAQPAVSESSAIRSAGGLALEMIVESAHADGAVTVGLAVAHQALGALPVTAISADEA